MEYKVIPFVPSIDARKGNPKDVAAQLENLIEKLQEKGWNYVRLESVSTFVGPESGCFGIGNKGVKCTHRANVAYILNL